MPSRCSFDVAGSKNWKARLSEPCVIGSEVTPPGHWKRIEPVRGPPVLFATLNVSTPRPLPETGLASEIQSDPRPVSTWSPS